MAFTMSGMYAQSFSRRTTLTYLNPQHHLNACNWCLRFFLCTRPCLHSPPHELALDHSADYVFDSFINTLKALTMRSKDNGEIIHGSCFTISTASSVLSRTSQLPILYGILKVYADTFLIISCPSWQSMKFNVHL